MAQVETAEAFAWSALSVLPEDGQGLALSRGRRAGGRLLQQARGAVDPLHAPGGAAPVLLPEILSTTGVREALAALPKPGV